MKHRKCLKCGGGFSSEWSGERICPRCKTSKAWRDGSMSTARSVDTGHRRASHRD